MTANPSFQRTCLRQAAELKRWATTNDEPLAPLHTTSISTRPTRDITNRALTLNQNAATALIECIAGCTVELNALETGALLNPLHPGFRLRCVLVGDDPGPTDPVIFTYPRSMTFRNIVNMLNVNQVFTEILGADLLNEDVNGLDEIRAIFTLTDLSNGQSVIRRSPRVQIAL
ncbi:hypothetical protein PS639_04402 [Pseudomonas fluorescens]|nr:hypothetical protein PS639_04402 [Pseudomonas fluorescens]